MANLSIDLGVLEHKLHQAHRSAVQAELNAAGLQEIGHPLLLCILRSAGDRCPHGQVQAQRELARLLDISPAAVATSLKSLEKKGYIHREPEPGDARRNRVRLTPKGQQAVDDCYACLQRVSRRMYAGFSTQEQTQLHSYYLRALDNLRPEPQSPPAQTGTGEQKG